MASKIKSQVIDKLPVISKYIAESKLDSTQRVDAALEYVISHPNKELNAAEFEEACGVGVVVSPEEIEQEVEKLIQKHKEEIKEKRYNIRLQNFITQHILEPLNNVQISIKIPEALFNYSN